MSTAKTDIWIPLYIGDYLADTMHLTTEQHGAYLLLIFHLWRRGQMPNDDRTLARIARLTPARWATHRPVLEEFFIVSPDGWTHGRVDKERARIEERSLANTQRAQKAAAGRWDNQKQDASSIDRSMLEESKSQSHSQSEVETKVAEPAAAPLPVSAGASAKRTADVRHAPFRGALSEYWAETNPASPQMPWEARDGKALNALLKASPEMQEAEFRRLLGNRARSAVAHGDRVYLWIANQILTLNYMEGLSGPVHFSQYAGKEVAMGAARKWSVDDVAGLVGIRCERQLPAAASVFGAQRQSQILIASSSPDGTVQMVAPGVYNDNGRGIDCQYETTSTQDLMSLSMLGGVAVNALGEGSLAVSVMVARKFTDSPGMSREIRLAPFRLTPENWKGYSGGGRGQNERFRMRFTNGCVANAWFALKYCSLFTRPLFSGRTGGGR